MHSLRHHFNNLQMIFAALGSIKPSSKAGAGIHRGLEYIEIHLQVRLDKPQLRKELALLKISKFNTVNSLTIRVKYSPGAYAALRHHKKTQVAGNNDWIESLKLM
jgi:hypothetical protein